MEYHLCAHVYMLLYKAVTAKAKYIILQRISAFYLNEHFFLTLVLFLPPFQEVIVILIFLAVLGF